MLTVLDIIILAAIELVVGGVLIAGGIWLLANDYSPWLYWPLLGAGAIIALGTGRSRVEPAHDLR